MNIRLPVASAVMLLAPIGIVAVGLAGIALGERLGTAPLSGLIPENSAEAAALHSPADLLRFLRAGEDPRRVYPVRAEVISSAVLHATTLEAAVWSRQLALMQLLDRQGAIGQGEERRTLACLAADLGVEDVVEYLAPADGADCEPGKAFDFVVARTSGGERRE